MATTSKTRNKSVARGKVKKAKRTVLYSRSGKKLYAKRSKSGKFTDIQSYQRAHSADLKRTSKSERAAHRKKKPATTTKATKKAKVVKAVVAKRATQKKKAARKVPAVSAATAPVVELAVPELAVTTSVQGEVPAGGE